MSVPITIGVTGHRQLRPEDLPALRRLVGEELDKLQQRCPHSPLVMLNSLAAGGDTLCAEIAVQRGIALVCPLPMPIEQYRSDFSEEEAAVFDTLCAKAASVFVAPDTEPAPAAADRDFHYRQAGLYVAEHCHVLLALWDGGAPSADGCGTAETVDFVLQRHFCQSDGFRAAGDGAVIHLTASKNPAEKSVPSARLLENQAGALADCLAMTDAFNADAAALPQTDERPLIPQQLLQKSDPQVRLLHAAYQKADALSLRFQKHYLRILRALSYLGVALVLTFLLYDEFESNLFLPLYAALIAASFAVYLWSGRGKYHTKYLQYRTLAEALRIQFFLAAAGIGNSIGTAFTWTQKQDSLWVKKALGALLAGPPAAPSLTPDEIRSCWIDSQLAYHRAALVKTHKADRLNTDTARLMLGLSVGLFVIVFALEFLLAPLMGKPLFSGAMPAFLLFHNGQQILVRGVFKILLGGISSVTLFLSNYYGKLSLQRRSADHAKMAELYAIAQKQYDTAAPREALLWALGREEIIENGNWHSYIQDNAPSVNL